MQQLLQIHLGPIQDFIATAVYLLERHGNRGKESRFPSMSHVAAHPILLKLIKQDWISKHFIFVIFPGGRE